MPLLFLWTPPETRHDFQTAVKARKNRPTVRTARISRAPLRRQRAGAREERMRFSSAQHRRNRAPDGGVSPSSSHSKKKPRMPH